MKPIKTTPKIKDSVSILLVPVTKPAEAKGSNNDKKSS